MCARKANLSKTQRDLSTLACENERDADHAAFADPRLNETRDPVPMLHFTRLKIVVILLICLAGFLVALPNFFSKETVASWPSFMPKQQLRLGLDLQGGAHLLLAMDQEEIKKDWMNNLRDESRKILRDAKIGFTGIGAQGTQLVIKLAKPEDRDEAFKGCTKSGSRSVMPCSGPEATTSTSMKGRTPGTIIVKETDAGLKQRISDAAAASIETINRRVNNLGTSESTIVRQGADRILIQFPGLKDTKELKKLIGETAKLTFHEVHPSISAEDAKLTTIPRGYKIYQGDKGEGETEYLLRETAGRAGRGSCRRTAWLRQPHGRARHQFPLQPDRGAEVRGTSRRITSGGRLPSCLTTRCFRLRSSANLSSAVRARSRAISRSRARTGSPCSCDRVPCRPN